MVEGQLSGGNVTDVSLADVLATDIVDCMMVADRGYDSDAHRCELMANNNTLVIPGRNNRKVEIVYDNTLYRWRCIEMFFGKLKEDRRLAVRYEKINVVFLGFIALAAILIHLC